MLSSYRYPKKKRRLRTTTAILMIALIVTAGACILFAPKNSTTVAEVLIPTQAPVLEKTATLKLTTLYACGHQKSRLLPLPENLAKKTKEETAKLYPDWHILNFEEQFLVAEEKLNTECDIHFLLKLSKNKIIVTKKNAPNEIIMEEKIDLSVLTKEDKSILATGISVNSEYELLEILESFR